MIDWKSKLSSRKFWAFVSVFAIAVLTMFRTDAETSERVSALIVALGDVVAYILTEGKVDAARVSKKE
jgi:hypothetical protein